MTIKEVIGNYHARLVQDYVQKLYQIKAPKIMIQGWEKSLNNFKTGHFKVKCLSRKYQVADVEVKVVSLKKAKTYVYSTPVKGHVSAKLVPTTIIKMETDQGIYYYDAENMKIENSLMALNVEDDRDVDFKVQSN